jgi:hypothetical protein
MCLIARCHLHQLQLILKYFTGKLGWVGDRFDRQQEFFDPKLEFLAGMLSCYQ